VDSSLFKRKQFNYLAHLLGFSESQLKCVLENISNFYYSYEEMKLDKITGKPKMYNDGTLKKRTITPSTHELKKIQRAIKRKILDPISMPGHVQGAVTGRSNISNAKLHQGKKFRFVTDLKDFFPSVSNDLVFSFFLSLGYSQHISGWLTKLTTYKGRLPQGASTSPALANFCFLEIDNAILEICEREGITYSRFVDDLTYSSPVDFRNQIEPILDMILKGGFKISRRKTEYGNQQMVTGLRVYNNYIDVPNEIKDKATLILDHTGFVVYRNNVRNTNTNMRTYSGLVTTEKNSTKPSLSSELEDLSVINAE
jgi:RNA-directed DNA polymerase